MAILTDLRRLLEAVTVTVQLQKSAPFFCGNPSENRRLDCAAVERGDDEGQAFAPKLDGLAV
jgi:hypothetical protein